MKKYLKVLIFAIVAGSSLSYADQDVTVASEREKIEELGRVLHYLAHACDKETLSKEHREKIDSVEVLAADLTISQNLEATNFKIDGRDAIAIARSKGCGSCDWHVEMWERALRSENFMVNTLGAGHLTKKQLRKNEELSKKLDEFERSMWILEKQNEKFEPFLTSLARILEEQNEKIQPFE